MAVSDILKKVREKAGEVWKRESTEYKQTDAYKNYQEQATNVPAPRGETNRDFGKTTPTTTNFQYNPSHPLERSYTQTVMDRIKAQEIADIRSGLLERSKSPLSQSIQEKLGAQKKAVDDFNSTTFQPFTDIPEEHKPLTFEETIAEQRRKEIERDEKFYRNISRSNPGIASVMSVAGNIASASNVGNLIGDYIVDRELDELAKYNDGSRMKETIRQSVSENIGNSFDNKTVGQVASFLYNTGMSMADSVTATALLGPAAGAIAGSSAAVDSVREGKAKGYDDDRAFFLGVLAGAAEGITEKIGMDALFDTKTLSKNAATYVLQSALSEGTEEVASSWMNLCYDTIADIIAGTDQGTLLSSIKAYKKKGKSDAAAVGLAIKDIAVSMGLDFLGGALSGGVMGAGAALTNTVTNRIYGVPMGTKTLDALRGQKTDLSEINRQMVMDYAPVLGKAGSTVLTGMYEGYEGSLSAGVYIPEMTRYYEAGRTGKPINEVKTETDSGLTGQMREAAYMAGKTDARSAENAAKAPAETMAEPLQDMAGNEVIAPQKMAQNRAVQPVVEDVQQTKKQAKTINETIENETPISYNKNIAYEEGGLTGEEQTGRTEENGLRDSSERFDRAYTGRQAGAVAEGARQVESRWQTVSRTAKDGGTAALTYGNEISVAELGIAKGSQTNVVRVIKGGDTEYTREARRVAKENGIRIVMVDRDMIIDGKSVRGYISGDRMFINVNHADFTADQIARHEAAHKKINQGKININEVKAKVAEKYDVAAVSELYASAYASSGMTADQAFIEMICDAEGDMNIFEGKLEVMAAPYAEFLQTAKQETRESESRTKAKAEAEVYGEDEAFSLNSPKRKKEKYWHTGFTVAEMQSLENRIKIDAVDSTNQLSDTVNWYFGRGGTPYFAVYSTEDVDNPTILYASKGITAQKEKNAIENILRRYNSANTNAGRYDRYMQESGGASGRSNTAGIGTLQTRDAAGNDSLDVNQFWNQLTAALRTVLKNTLKIPHSTGSRENRPLLAGAGGAGQRGGVEGNYSANLDTDSLGNNLSEQQREYFAESKVRNANGNLKMMFRGGDEEFSVFDRKKSKYSNLYGRGFYFTDSESHAKQYGNIKRFYLNIVNPVSTNENTISKQQFKKFLEAVAENEDDFSFENYGYGATVESVLKSIYNKDRSDFNLLYDVSQTAIGDMVAAVELFNNVNGTSFDGLILDTETVAFYPEQIKDASNKKPTNNPDVYFSANPDNDVESLRAENWRLRQNIEWLKRGEANEVLEKDVKYEAGQLLQAYGSTANKNEIAEEMQRLGNYIVQNGENVQWEQVKDRAAKIAREVIDNVAVLVNDEQMQEFSEIRKYLRKGFSRGGVNQIKIADEYRNDVDPDFEAWRRKHMGQFVISKNGTPIDSLWMDMQEKFGERWFPEDITQPGDQLRHIGTLFDETMAIYENPWSYDMAVAVESCANDLLDRLTGNVRTERVTEEEYVEHGKEWFTAQEYKRDAERAARAIERLKEKQKKEIGAVWDRYKEKSENRALRYFRESILKHVSSMTTKLLHPTDKSHVPEALKKPALDLLSAINADSGYAYEFIDGKYKLVKVEDAQGETAPTKRTMQFEVIRSKLKSLALDLVIDPDLLGDSESSGLIDDVIALGNKRMGDMNREELETIWKALRAIETAISTSNKLFTAGKMQNVDEAADGLRRDNAGKKSRGEVKLGQKSRDLLKVDMLTPETYFHILDTVGDDMFRMMRDSQDKEIKLLKEAVDFSNRIIGKEKINKLGKEIHTVTLGGEEVKLSTAQIMELYVLSNREQARQHLLVGGVMPTAIKGKGNKMITRDAPARNISPDEIRDAVSLLTAEQTELADKMQQFLSSRVAEWGNEASMLVYNYKKFGEKDYWPIKSNRQELKKSVEQDTKVTSVANKGMTKATVPNANNSVMLGNVFDTFSNHIVEMASYSAWLATMEDVNRIRNYKFKDQLGETTGTVDEILKKVHGSKGSGYLSTLLADLANGSTKVTSGNPFGSLMGKYKAAAVGGNLRVIVQQPTAALRALAMIDPQYFVAGINVTKAWKKAKEYAPIAQWKDWGYFDINTGRQIRDVMFKSDPAINKVQNLFMAGASMADSLTWGRIWAACEAETRHKHKELAKGSKEFYETVAKRFTEIIDHTQVVDGMLQRSQVMRNQDNLAKMATSFMGEPTKTYNMLYSAWYDATHKKGKQSKINLARTAVAFTASAVINAVMQSFVDALRDDDKEKEYWEKWLNNFFGFTGEEKKTKDYIDSFLAGNLPSAFNPLGYVPYFKDVVSLIQGYDVSRMDMDSVESTITAAQNMLKALGKEGKYSTAGASANLFLELARLLGLPVANVKRDIKSIVMTAAIETDNYLLQYRMEKALLDVNYTNNSGIFMGILYNAYKNDREAYLKIYEDLVNSGYDVEKIKKAMEKKMVADAGLESVEELERRWATPDQETMYQQLRGIYGNEGAADDYAYVKSSEDFEDASGEFYDALYDAMDEDFESYKRIYDDLYRMVYEQKLEKIKEDGEIPESDWEEEAEKEALKAITSNMENRMKKAEGVEKVEELSERYLNPYEKEGYDKTINSLPGGKNNALIQEYAKGKNRDDDDAQYDVLVEAYAKDPSAYNTIYRDMISSGIAEDKIRSAIENRWKNAQNVESVDDLQKRWLSPEEETEYNKTLEEIKRSSIWSGASAEQRDKTLAKLYDLAVKTDKEDSAGTKMQKKIDGGKEYGLTESEYLLFLVAQQMTDKPNKNGNLGSYTNDERRAAIKMLGLSREESAYLWEVAGGHPNSNPWR